jgi:uncharacterized protein (DUF433 family)
MNWRDHITSDENVLIGKPVVIGTRIAVEFIVERLASGWSEQQILDNYPTLTKKDLQAVFLYIQESMKDGLIINSPQKTA